MTAKQRRVARTCHRRTEENDEDDAAEAIRFQIRSATGAAGTGSTNYLLQYSTDMCWQSYVRQKETLVLALEAKTLLSEIRILNKNACAVSVSVAMEDKFRSYIHVKRVENLPHYREVCVKLPYFPCNFARLEFEREAQPSIAVYAYACAHVFCVPCDAIEAKSGSSLYTVLSHTTENILFGSSLPASQPFMDCLSDHNPGSLEWMVRRRGYLLDEKITRLEAALFSKCSTTEA